MNSKGIFLACAVLSAIVALASCVPARASTLELLGVGWDKPTVTVLIKAGKGVTQQALEDIMTAVDDWNSALSTVESAPTLVLVSGTRTADIVIRVRVGGGRVLGQTRLRTVSHFSCVLKGASIVLSGKAFGQRLSSAGIRNVTRHELGHALGLGHSDDPDDLMYATADSEEVSGDVDVYPSACDLKGIDAIYPLPGDCSIPDYVECP